MAEIELVLALMDGLNQPFHDFVMKPNADRAKWKALRSPPNGTRSSLTM